MYDEYVHLPSTEEEWEEILRGFIENYEFPCVAAWDGFHVEVSTNLKNYYSFKKRYTVTNMGLVAYNKRFLNADVGGIVSAHDARLLRESTVYRQILNGGGIPQRTLALGDYGEIPLTTIGNDAFPKFS